MKLLVVIILAVMGAAPLIVQQQSVPSQPAPDKNSEPITHSLLSRRYREGERLSYRMKGVNGDWRYEVRANGVVKKDSGGFLEEYGWSNMISNNAPEILPPASLSFRQQLSLDPVHAPAVPDLSTVSPKLIGPVTDLLTFYADLWLAGKLGSLAKAGDHFYFKTPGSNSWADGNYVLIGADAIDFDFTLVTTNLLDKTAKLLVRHVPPREPGLKFPATWMTAPVADTPNNWMEVRKEGNGKYVAGAGKETFDVQINLSLVDGKILSASIDNPVEIAERICAEAALTVCGEPTRRHIRRQIELQLQD